jgi:integrase
MGRPKGAGVTPILKGSTWYVSYRLNGKQTTKKTEGCRTRADALEWGLEFLLDLKIEQAGIKYPNNPEYTEEVIRIGEENYDAQTKYLDHITKDIDKYIKYCNLHYTSGDARHRIALVKRFKKWLSVKNITRWEHFNDFEAWINSLNLQPLGVHSYAIRMRAFFTWLVKEKAISKNPVELKKYKLAPKILQRMSKKIMPLTDDDIVRIEKVMGNERDKTVWALCLHTGMRISEVINLLWKNVDLVNKIIYVKANDVDGNRGILKSTLKTSNSDRKIPIKKVLLTILQTAKVKATSAYVVEPMRKRGEYDWSAKSPITTIRPDFHTHLLRHTFITRFLHVKNVTIFEVATIAGNTPQEIQKTYGHFFNTGNINKF